jgi:type 2A phosphatase activator TIP41
MDYYKAGPWEITTSQGMMMGSDALDLLQDEIKVKLPALIYRDTYARIQHVSLPFKFEVNTKPALELISLEKRASRLTAENPVDQLTYIPKDVKVSMSSHWENRTIPKTSTFSEDCKEQIVAPVFNSGSDWTYTTLYKGSPLGSFQLAPTEESIPIHRLGMDNPILWASEIILYEDELDDNGQCKLTFRVRAMGDCLFGLLRFYLRVDHVMVRICDTRLFIDYSQNTLLREFQVKEANYEDLQRTGFDTGPSWTLNARQSDLVFGSLGLVHAYKDRVTF